MPGTLIACKEVKITRDAYGPVMVLCCWAKGYHEPLYVVSNMDTAEGRHAAIIKKSVSVSRLFSQTRKAGVPYIHKSHISDPQRLSRLFIAACLAYI